MAKEPESLLAGLMKWDALLGQRVLDSISFAVPAFLFSAFTISPKAADLEYQLVQFLVLGVFLIGSLIRLVTGWTRLRSLRFHATSAVFDILGLYLFLSAISLAYAEPLSLILKAPTTYLLFVFIVARVVLFDIRLIAFTGACAAAGWVSLVFLALLDPASGGTTRQFAEYMTSKKVLIGAQVEQVISILLVTVVSAAVINAYQKDGLTGLRKRREFLQALKRRIPGKSRDGKTALILVRIANWQDIARSNKQLADQLLKSTVSALSAAPIPIYMASRYEAGAILLWKRGAPNDEALKNHLKLLSSTVRDALAPHRCPIHIAAIQVSDYSSDAIRHLNAAINLAADRPGQIQLCDADFVAKINEQDRIEHMLETAIEDDALVVLHQPIVDLLTNRVVGTEALTRMKSKDGALLSPAIFIPIAERTGKIVEIGAHILKVACEQNKLLRSAGLGDEFFVSVNVAPPQIQSWTRLKGEVESAMHQGVPLKLEVTESVAAQDDDMLERISFLKACGAKIAIDDFGTGYSSLERLGDLPFDTVKIDLSFTRKITDDSGFAMIDAIVRMAKASGKDLIIEGIETAEQQALALQAGIRYGQGYHFGRPVSLEELLETANRSTSDLPDTNVA